MRVSKRVWWAVGVALLLVCSLCFTYWALQPPRWPPKPLNTAFYVWQMRWTNDVRQALERAAPSTGQFMVLLGEVAISKGTLTFNAAQLDWKALAKTHVQTTLVLRSGAGLNKQLAEDTFEHTRNYLASLLRDGVAHAQRAGVVVAGVQLDYDCPTSALSSYRRLLEALRTSLPQVEWSITTLPTWLKTSEFHTLVAGLSYYVLQVHSLEPPTTIDRPITLFDLSRAQGYLWRAAALNLPFYVALPTYGYQVAYDKTGRFVALSAEGPNHAWKPGLRVRTAMSDPGQISHMVASLRRSTPPTCVGIVWFRLPVESDDLNWSWTALQAVRQGRMPRIAFSSEIRNPSRGTYEVWLKNTGEMNITQRVQLRISWPGPRPLDYDVMNGFQRSNDKSDTHGLGLVGPAPRERKPLLIARFHLGTRDDTASGQPPLRVANIEIVPDDV